MAKWIWKFGEFEIYHNMLVHNRREAYGYREAPVWKIYSPEPAIDFRKDVTTDGGWIHISSCGDISVSRVDENGERSYETRGAKDIYLEPGSYTLEVRVINHETFPSIYIEGVIETDETWMADDFTMDFKPVGTWDRFNCEEKRPDQFPFQYKNLHYLTKEKIGTEGCLFDFGAETFASISITGLIPQKSYRIQYGESREEALDPEWSVIHFDRFSTDGTDKLIPYAFRYIYISNTDAEVEAQYEYLPMERKGSFMCDYELLNHIWDIAADTFHLNCREFFLDGIKRDRWVWSADVYQSLFVNRYLFSDKEIEQRTLIALGGKIPFRRHINTIMDYTFFWFMSLYEHYITYGDLDFLKKMKPQMDEIMKFCIERTDQDGFIRGREGDWIFIDWADMDKTGALCGEQILYAKAMKDYSRICSFLQCEDQGCAKKAENLQNAILQKYWDNKKECFIDSFESGKRNVTRQNNILAFLYLPCTERQKKHIYQNVILNEEIPAITTPYFKFYENQVHCLSGHSDDLEESISSYYGSMLNIGATSLYEQYDPKDNGTEHYAMYGRKFEKSLCHAWSASPVYLLGQYRLGVKNTGIAYHSFEIRPYLGKLRQIEGKVPVPGGYVYVKADEKTVTVYSDIPGGTLYIDSKTYVVEANKELCIKR